MALVHVQRSPTPSSSSSPCVSESGSGEDNRRSQTRSISESFLTVKGAALFLPRGNGSSPSSESRISQRSKHTGDLQQHLQIMFTVLRPEDNIRLAVRLESAYPHSTRYMVVVSTNGRQDTEESVVLGVDFASSDCSCSVGLVLPLWSDTLIHLDGDGGFSVSTVNRVHVFKPVSVQAMWSALQSLHKACEVARCHNYYPGSLFLTWVSYYQSRVTSDQLCINEWNAMQDVQSHRADSPVLFTDVPTERERTERLIKTRLREIMMQKDLENVTSKEIRTELEMQMVCNLREFKEFIDNEMIVILGQMDSPTEIFDHVFLGSEWNASNLEELQNSGVRYILNVTREIDNFFPGLFEYHNIRVYDEEATNLLEYWNDTFKFISKAKKAGVKCLVHCKMGVSRSASTVIAYAMKEYGWDLDTAFDYVKERRAVTKPNPSFMRQLEEYQGILLASKQRHNKLWRSRSDSDLSDRHQQFCKPPPDTLSHSHPQNNNNNSPPPSLHHFLGVAVLQALRADPQDSSSPPSDTPSDAAERTGSRARASPPPVSNGHSALQGRGRSQDPVLPPRPRPRAATVVPEERRDTASLKATLALPLVTPHPPRVLHILPPSAQTPPPRGPPSPSPLPEQGIPLALSLDLPDLSSSETSSEADTPGDSLSELVSERLDSNDSVPMAVSPLSPTATHLEYPFPTDDPNNNNPTDPSWGRPGGGLDSPTDRSSSLSTDSIDFVSAREKFLGLSQEDRTRSLSEQGPQRTPPPSEEPGPDEAPQQEKISPLAEDRVDRSILDKSSHLHFNHNHPPDNGVSVRHIVTEIESISHPPPRSPQQPRADHGEEDQETGEVTRGSLTPPSYPQSPSTPPPDWPVGSVRRVTKQLEQRLRQELDTPSLPAQRSPEQPPSRSPLCSAGSDLRSPLPSPGAEAAPPARSPLLFPSVPAHTPNTDCLPPLHAPSPDLLLPCPSQPTLSISSAAPHGSQPTPSQPSPRDVEESNTDSKRGVNSFSDMDTLPDPHSDPSPIIIIQPSLDPCPEPLASPGPLLWLDGVTLLDSETEPAPPCDALARLAPSSQELERIQETLRELQAFLYEAGGQTGAPDTPDSLEQDLVQAERARRMGPEAERELCQGAGPRRPPRETPVWQRAMEIEARIRQAGLTPPSLMKRSASLAKLDCLELSTNDLNDWELCPAPYLASSSAAPQDPPSPAHPSPDDVWKKQRVLSQSPPSPGGQTLRAGAGLQLQGAFLHPPLHLPDSSEPSPPPRPPQQGEGGGEEGSPDPSQTSRSVQVPAVMSGRQQGRGHPLRRLRKAADKKRTNTVLYNTM